LNFNITGSATSPKTTTAPGRIAPAPQPDHMQGVKPAPSATVEISAAARQAHSGGAGHAGKHGPRPLNIIWGDSPK